MRTRFGDFELDDERFVLSRAGAVVELRPKVFDLLVTLVRERHRVVRREELFAALWSTTAVGPGSLAGLVNELRRALGEDGRGPSSIRTVHARGYQFAAAVEAAVEVDAAPEGASGSVAPSGIGALEAVVPSPIAPRLQRAFFEVQRSGSRALLALVPDRRRRTAWLGAAGEQARRIGFEPRWLALPTEGEGVREARLVAPGPWSGSEPSPSARDEGEARGTRTPIVLCLDVEAEADWRRAGGIRRCLDLMGGAPVLVLAALGAPADARSLGALVESDPRIECIGTEVDGEVLGVGARADGPRAERSATLVETLQGLAAVDRAAFEGALRGMGFEARGTRPIRSLRRVEPAAARTGRARERDAS